MRSYHFKHDGVEYELAATFAASVEIAAKVADPIKIAREAVLEDVMMRSRIPYKPSFDFTVSNVPMIIWIGLKAAGSEMTLADVQSMVFDAGFLRARDWATSYLALIVEPKPAKPDPAPENGKEASQKGEG